MAKRHQFRVRDEVTIIKGPVAGLHARVLAVTGVFEKKYTIVFSNGKSIKDVPFDYLSLRK